MKRMTILVLCVLLVFLFLFLTLSNQNFLKNKLQGSQIVSDHSASENYFTQSEAHTSENSVYKYSNYMPVEMVISRRMSVRNYDLNIMVPSELVTKVLWAAYGYYWRGRTVPSFSGYPVIIYVSNKTATYKFVPESQSLTLWKEGDYRDLGKGAGWNYPAPVQLYIVLDKSKLSDDLWGNAESGCVIQNIYLMADALNLGTVNTYPNRDDIKQGLGLPADEKVLYKMPLGYPLSPYTDYQNLVPTSRPSSPELPEIKDSYVSLEDALTSISPSHQWSKDLVKTQELSQMLWASYGYSYYEDTAETPPERHRTVPSSHGYYPMKVYVANSSGVYVYLPEQHSLTTIVGGDRRSTIAQASGYSWVATAPLILVQAWYDDGRQWLGGEETYVEAGLIAQEIYLESAAWGLIADWRKASSNEGALKTALGLTDVNLHPTSIITVGHPSRPADLNRDGLVNIVDIVRIASAFTARATMPPWQPPWKGTADVNRDGVINIVDIGLATKDFG